MVFRRLRRRALIAMTALTVVLCVVALVRALAIEQSPILILTIAVAPILLLPAWGVAAYGIVTRRLLFAAVGAVLVALHVWWSLADVSLGGGGAGPGDLRVATANVLANNASVGVLFESLAAQDADVILLQEMTPEQLARIERTASYDDYPHRVLDPLPGAHGSVIVSRLPIADGGVIWPAGWPMTQALVETGDSEPVQIVNVHVIAPLAAQNIEIWRQQFEDLVAYADQADAPLVIAGDFNATRQHTGLGDLLATGLVDAHDAAGRGRGATFPAGSIVPPVLRLDHVLVGNGIEATGIDVLSPLGSDHRPLVVDLVLP